MTTRNPFQWANFQQFPPDVQREWIQNLKEMMPELTWKGQVDQMIDAPAEVILEFLPLLVSEAQVKVYKDCLPVRARKQALELLSEEAKSKLRLKPQRKCLA